MFDRLTIPRRLGASFAILIGVVALVMAVCAVSLGMISSTTARNSESREILADLLKLETSLLRQNSQLRGFLVTGDEIYLKSYYEGEADYDRVSPRLEARLASEFDNPALPELIRTSRDETLKWRRDWGDKYIDIVKSGARSLAQEAVRAAGKKVLVSAAVLPLREVRDEVRERAEAISAKRENHVMLGWLALGLGAALIIGVAMWLARNLARSIAEPLVEMTDTMTQLASGRSDVSVPAVDRGDELGAMAKGLHAFRDAAVERERSVAEREEAMAKIGANLAAVADADLSVRLTNMPEAFQGVADDFNEAMERLCNAMRGVQYSVQTIDFASGEIQQATGDLAHRSEQQVAKLQGSTDALKQLTVQIESYAQIATEVSGAMHEARSEAENGGDVVARAIEAMGNVERASAEISDINAMIDGIAFQTNLLALNAGVEAARAGEAGKGFSVVASEVRALAQRATESANAIKQRVASVTTHVQSGVTLVNETGTALEAIIGRVGEVTQSIATIAESASEQRMALASLNEGVAAMDNMTQQNAAMVEQTNAATVNLRDEATRLSHGFASFQIGEAGDEGAMLRDGASGRMAA